jgi:hypothetical protein
VEILINCKDSIQNKRSIVLDSWLFGGKKETME